MYKKAYEKLPDDLKKVIDNNSGQRLAAEFDRGMDAGDKVAKAIAEKAAHKIVQLDAAETDRWRQGDKKMELKRCDSKQIKIQPKSGCVSRHLWSCSTHLKSGLK